MKKRKRKREVIRTPEEIAKEFWIAFHQQIQDKILQSIKDQDIPPDEKIHLHKYIHQQRSLPANEPVGSLKALMLDHHFFVNPDLPWDKIKSTLQMFNMDDLTIEALLFILKPGNIDQKFLPEKDSLYFHIMEIENNICHEANREVRELAPLVKRLRNLQERNASYADCSPLTKTILIMEHNIEVNREIVKRKRNIHEYLRKSHGFDKDLNKSPQKHKYWNIAVSRALAILNPLCHSDNCETGCRKSHQNAITAVAELLKILYPAIWKENIKTIANRIKQKDYRNIST